jgi:AcrR family transcriptional regulator
MAEAVRVVEPARRSLSGRQADKVERLLGAAIEELRINGYDGLTVRNVARRADVAAATAYTYLASKDHLIAEVFWRRLQALPAPAPDRRRAARGRVADALRDVGSMVAAEPELAAACTTAILANDPDVHRLRARIGLAFDERLRAALGDDADPAALRALGLALSGALLQAGMGYFAYEELADRLEEVAGLVLGGQR